MALRRITFSGGRTYTASAIRQMRTSMFTSDRGDRSDAENIAIFFTDGNSNIEMDRTIPEAIQSRIDVSSYCCSTAKDISFKSQAPPSENIKYLGSEFSRVPVMGHDGKGVHCCC